MDIPYWCLLFVLLVNRLDILHVLLEAQCHQGLNNMFWSDYFLLLAFGYLICLWCNQMNKLCAGGGEEEVEMMVSGCTAPTLPASPLPLLHSFTTPLLHSFIPSWTHQSNSWATSPWHQLKLECWAPSPWSVYLPQLGGRQEGREMPSVQLHMHRSVHTLYHSCSRMMWNVSETVIKMYVEITETCCVLSWGEEQATTTTSSHTLVAATV